MENNSFFIHCFIFLSSHSYSNFTIECTVKICNRQTIADSKDYKWRNTKVCDSFIVFHLFVILDIAVILNMFGVVI